MFVLILVSGSREDFMVLYDYSIAGMHLIMAKYLCLKTDSNVSDIRR